MSLSSVVTLNVRPCIPEIYVGRLGVHDLVVQLMEDMVIHPLLRDLTLE